MKKLAFTKSDPSPWLIPIPPTISGKSTNSCINHKANQKALPQTPIQLPYILIRDSALDPTHHCGLPLRATFALTFLATEFHVLVNIVSLYNNAITFSRKCIPKYYVLHNFNINMQRKHQIRKVFLVIVHCWQIILCNPCPLKNYTPDKVCCWINLQFFTEQTHSSCKTVPNSMPQNLLHNLSCCDWACSSGTAQGDSQWETVLSTNWGNSFHAICMARQLKLWEN